MQKTLMILGAGVHQLSTIKEALDNMDLKVVIVDKDKDAAGFIHLQDDNLEKINLSVKDEDSLLEVACAYSIDGIIAPCADAGIRTAGYINDKMNLKGPSYLSTLVCQDKHLMYDYFNNYTDIRMPKRYHWSGISGDCFPLISKPVTGVGSKEVYRYDSLFAFNRNFDFDNSNNYVIEEFVEGDLYTNTVIMQNGRAVYSFTLSQTLMENNFGTGLFTYPSKGGLNSAILLKSLDVIRALGIRDGAVEVEGIINPAKRINIIDVNPRMAGGFIFDAHSEFTNTNMIKAAIDASLGNIIHIVPSRKTNYAIMYKGVEDTECEEGVIDDISYSYSDFGTPRHQKRLIKPLGSPIKPCNTKETASDQFVVAVYADGYTAADAYNKCALICNDIEIGVKENEDSDDDWW